MIYGNYLRDKYASTAVKLANAEGVPCVLEYSKGKNLRNYEVCGNSVQSGTPSPESPVEIQSVGDLVTDTESEYYGKYDIPITVTGTRSETTHIYLGEPLRKVGDYSDYIDFKNQKVVRNIHKIIIDENSVIRLYPYQDMNGVYIPLILPDSEIRANGLCTYSDKVGRTFDLGSIWCGVNDTAIYLIGILDILGLSTADEFIAWLSSLSIPFEIIYCRTESTEENISLPALKNFKGTSIMSVDTAVLPSNIKAKYIRT